MSKKNSIEEIQKIFSKDLAELDLTSEYKDRKSPTLKYTCRHGKEHTTSLAHWQKGTRCLCEKNYTTRVLHYNKAEELLLKYAAFLITPFEEYTTVSSPIEFENCSGELQNISLSNLNVCDKFFELKEEITKLVVENKKQIEIAEKFNTTQHIISMCLRLWGINNSNGNRFILRELPKDDLYKMYWEEKHHPKDIATKYNCSITTVVRNMHNYNIPLRTKSESRIGELNPIYNVGHTLEAREKMSASFLEDRKYGYSTTWGKPSKYTTPNQGVVTMRSSWEVRVADYLTYEKELWYYEPKVFKLTDIISYKPDFYLPRLDTYLEVKGRMMELDLNKVEYFRALDFRLVLLNRDILENTGLINSSGKIIYNKEVLPIDLLLERYL